MKSKFSNLVRHVQRATHYKKCRLENRPPITDFIESPEQKRKIVIREIKFAAIIADDFLAFKNSHKLLKSIKNVSNARLWLRLNNMGETKFRNIITNVIVEGEKLDLNDPNIKK